MPAAAFWRCRSLEHYKEIADATWGQRRGQAVVGCLTQMLKLTSSDVKGEIYSKECLGW